MKRLIFVLTVLLSGVSFAQNPIKSPYSRFGVGLLQHNSTASSFALGGNYTAWADSNYVNYGNPASYTFIAQQRPIFDVGIGGNYTELKSSTGSAITSGSGLRNIVLGIPVSKRMGAAFGLTPFSNHGYKIVNTSFDENDKEIDFVYEGDGGLTRFFGGLSYAPMYNDSNKLSVGLNVSYTFGNLRKERYVLFEDPTYRNAKVLSNTQIRGLLLDAGLIYEGRINKKVKYRFGATYALGRDLKSTRDALSTTFTYQSGIVESSIDTLEIIENSSGFLRLPGMQSLGFQFEINTGNKAKDRPAGLLTIGIQARLEEWGDYLEVFDGDTINDNLQRSNTLSLGIEYLPLISLTGEPKYLKLIKYRAGFRYNQSYLNIAGQTINDYGISFGVGLPLINTRSTSSLNLSVELGKRGTTENLLIEEQYAQFMIGFTLSPTGFNKWFVKRKYE